MNPKNSFSENKRARAADGNASADTGCEQKACNNASADKEHVQKAGGNASADDKRAREKRFTRRLALSLTAVVFLTVLIASGAFAVLFLRPEGGFLNRPVSVTVPDVTGLDESAALARITEAGGASGNEGFAGNEDFAGNKNFVENNCFAAKQRFAAAKQRFAVSLEYRHDANVPRGTVISQSPVAGSRRKVTPGVRPCTLTVCISLGKESAVVPDVCGLSLREAKGQLTALGFCVETDFCAEIGARSAPFGVPGGTGVPGSADVSGSIGGTGNISGGENALAIENTDEMGHAGGIFSTAGAWDIAGTSGSPNIVRGDKKVLAVDPPAGTFLTVGSTVTLTVQKETRGMSGVAQIPDLAGLSREEAQAKLISCGLREGVVTAEHRSGGVLAGRYTVSAQEYVAGTFMRRGTAVGYTLSEEPSPGKRFPGEKSPGERLSEEKSQGEQSQEKQSPGEQSPEKQSPDERSGDGQTTEKRPEEGQLPGRHFHLPWTIDR